MEQNLLQERFLKSISIPNLFFEGFVSYLCISFDVMVNISSTVNFYLPNHSFCYSIGKSFNLAMANISLTGIQSAALLL